MTKCPYHDACVHYDCPELCPCFCDSDDITYDDLHPEYLGLVMTDKNRWEYQQVVDAQSKERALTLKPLREENIGNGLKR